MTRRFTAIFVLWCLGWAALILGLTALEGRSSAQPGTWASGRPPVRFQGNTTAALEFVDPRAIGALWAARGNDAPPEGTQIMAFTSTWPIVTTMPNPCRFPDDRYARLLCHELGHVNGWTGGHED